MEREPFRRAFDGFSVRMEREPFRRAFAGSRFEWSASLSGERLTVLGLNGARAFQASVSRFSVRTESARGSSKLVMTIRRALFVVLACSITASAQNRPAPAKTELAPGIVLFMTPSYGDVGLDGNSIAVLSRDGVLVFDADGTPAASAAVLAEIRTLTDQPV